MYIYKQRYKQSQNKHCQLVHGIVSCKVILDGALHLQVQRNWPCAAVLMAGRRHGRTGAQAHESMSRDDLWEDIATSTYSHLWKTHFRPKCICMYVFHMMLSARLHCLCACVQVFLKCFNNVYSGTAIYAVVCAWALYLPWVYVLWTYEDILWGAFSATQIGPSCAFSAKYPLFQALWRARIRILPKSGVTPYE